MNTNVRPFYQGELVDLIVPTEEIARNSNWADWFNSQRTTANTHHGLFPNTRETQVRFVQEAPSHNRLSLLIVKHGEKDPIGTVSLSGIDFRRGCAEIAIIMDTELEAPSHPLSALEAISLMTIHAFDVLGLERIDSAQVFPVMSKWNQWMELLGFRSEGIKRKAFKKGNVYHDIVMMGCLRDNYERFVSQRNGNLWPGNKAMMREIISLPEIGFAEYLEKRIREINLEYFG